MLQGILKDKVTEIQGLVMIVLKKYKNLVSKKSYIQPKTVQKHVKRVNILEVILLKQRLESVYELFNTILM